MDSTPRVKVLAVVTMVAADVALLWLAVANGSWSSAAIGAVLIATTVAVVLLPWDRPHG